MQIQRGRGESLNFADIIIIIFGEEITARGKVLFINCKSRGIS
jgi:hypothetical protein